MKKLLSTILSLTMLCSLAINAFASESTITEIWDPTIYYENPNPMPYLSELGESERLIISIDEIEKLSISELEDLLREETPLTEEESSQIAAYYKSDDFANGISPIYGIYDHPEWYIKPYIKSSTRMVTYATTWIGIDAYRSSVGMSKGREETKQISFSLGYTGSAEIKDFSNELSASYSHTSSTTISESQQCPAWTTMNWRPYVLWDKQVYYGKMKITTIIPSIGGVYENVWYDDHEGENKKIVTETTEVWSRVNYAQDVNATTPIPSTGAPNV